MPVHFKKQALIKMKVQMETTAYSRVQVGVLLFDKAFTTILAEYSNYSNVISKKYAAEIPEYTGMNYHVIKLKEDKQAFFVPIYSLGPIELETLKTYIKTKLANGFIWLSKSPAEALILFDKKPNRSFCLCVDYQNLNNLTIQNQYPLSLIGKLFDQLGWAKKLTQLDLINAYH